MSTAILAYVSGLEGEESTGEEMVVHKVPVCEVHVCGLESLNT